MDIEKLNTKNCAFIKNAPLTFVVVCMASKNKPCEKCIHIDKIKCPGYRLITHNEPAKKVGKIPKYTNKEIADKLQITKRQVSKMRKEGKLPKEYMQ